MNGEIYMGSDTYEVCLVAMCSLLLYQNLPDGVYDIQDKNCKYAQKCVTITKLTVILMQNDTEIYILKETWMLIIH